MATFTERDPAERSAFNRIFYRDRRPTRMGHWVSQFFCWWARVGLPPRAWVALNVRGLESERPGRALIGNQADANKSSCADQASAV